jgi:hypothetical protein
MQRIVHKNGRRIGGKDQAELSCIFVDILFGNFFYNQHFSNIRALTLMKAGIGNLLKA